MSKRKLRPKRITEEEFQPIMEREWQPVKLTDDTLPSRLRSIPEDQRCHAYASGSCSGNYNQQYEGYKVGGVDIFRDARSHREPVDWNKDHYVIIRDLKNDNALLMYGPLKDNEHWINEIPDRLKNVEILTLDKDEGSRDE